MGLFKRLPALAVSSVLLLSGVSVAAPLNAVDGPANPIADPFESDSFYKAPDGFQSAAPGAILKYRSTPYPIALNGTPIPMEASWQILYRTQNSVGEPEAAAVTVIKPKNAKPGHLYSESFFTNAAYGGCAPSIALQTINRADNAFVQSQMPAILAALNEGWYISVADDNGPKGAYPAGPHMGYSTLDSVRAVKKSGFLTGISSTPVVTLNGYSGGGLAAAWATELHPTYSPELEIAGAAIGGLTPNLTDLLVIANELNYSNLAIPAIIGLSHDYANLTKWLNDNLNATLADEFWMAKKQCWDSNIMYTGKDLGSYFKNGLKSFLADPVPMSVVRDAGLMGQRSTPKIPWFLYESMGDKLAPEGVAIKLVEQHCKGGATIEYSRNTGNATHFEEGMIGFKDAFLWVRDRQNGKAVKSGCSNTYVNNPTLASVALDLMALYPADMIALILEMFKPFFGGP